MARAAGDPADVEMCRTVADRYTVIACINSNTMQIET